MSNQLENKRRTLAQMLANARLTKVAADQDIEQTTPLDQKDLGKEQTEEIHENIEGVNADAKAAANTSKDTVETPPNCQDLNKPAEAALSSTGSDIDVIHQCGAPAEMPKTASAYKQKLAGILSQMRKQASEQQKEQPQNAGDFRTGTEVLRKFASLSASSTAEDIKAAQGELLKLAATNPLFSVCRDRILMQKLAEDVDALAEAEGISPEEAAAKLDEAAAANPEMLEEAQDEANGEAVADLAEAESATAELMDGAQQLADNASSVLGQEVTPDQILNAIDEVEAQAAELGVPPEALVQAAIEEMTGAGDAEVTPEDEANAEAIMQEAAANGISPEEVLQMATEELGNAPEAAEKPGDAPKAADAGSEEAAPEKGQEKTASAKPAVAKTRRAQFVQHLMHQ